MQWVLPNTVVLITQQSRYEIFPWHQILLIPSPVNNLPSLPLPLCNHWCDFYTNSFVFPKMFYKWNHTVCSLLYWLLLCSIILYRLIHVLSHISSSFLLSLNNTFYCVDAPPLIHSLADDQYFCDYEYSCYICEKVIVWIYIFIFLK